MKSLKFIALFLAVALIFFFSACGKTDEEAMSFSEESTAVSSSLDDTFDNTDSVFEVDEVIPPEKKLSWPKSDMGELPEPEAEVLFIFKNVADLGASVTVGEFNEDDVIEYISELKELGFKEGMEIRDSDGIIFWGTTDGGSKVNISYILVDREGIITYTSLEAK